MGKYANLGDFLRSQQSAAIPVTFKEVERIIGHALPRSARYPAWWSNNPSNNVMTKIWLEAGFKTEQVDVEGRKLVFRRVEQKQVSPRPNSDTSATPKGLPPFYGSMKGLITVAPGVDLTKPAADPKSWKLRG